MYRTLMWVPHLHWALGMVTLPDKATELDHSCSSLTHPSFPKVYIFLCFTAFLTIKTKSLWLIIECTHVGTRSLGVTANTLIGRQPLREMVACEAKFGRVQKFRKGCYVAHPPLPLQKTL